MRAIEVTSEDPAVFCRNDDFAEAVCLPHGHSLSVCTEEGFQASDRYAGCLALLFRHADTGSLRRCEHCSRHHIQVNLILHSHDMVQSYHSLECSCMCKHHPAVYVTDGIDMRYVGLHGLLICDYASRSEFQADVGKIKRIDIGLSADCHKHLVCNDFLLFSLADEGDLET